MFSKHCDSLGQSSDKSNALFSPNRASGDSRRPKPVVGRRGFRYSSTLPGDGLIDPQKSSDERG
jgi:hypothetical protein